MSYIKEIEKGLSASTYRVLSTPISAFQIPGLITKMEEWIAGRGAARCITFTNVHVVMEALHDKEFNAVLNDERIVNCPDGMPIVWAGRKRGYELPRRVYGPDLMHDFCEATAKKEYRHFFYGGAPGVPEELAENLVRKFPGMQIVGMYSPPFRPLTLQEDQEATRMINEARPDVLWVGLGCPKQEKWAFAHLSTLNVPVIAAVGQAFDIYANRVGQAPAWMRNNGLEWLYRLATNPRRLWKRYLVYNSQFLLYLAAERMGFGNAGPHNG